MGFYGSGNSPQFFIDSNNTSLLKLVVQPDQPAAEPNKVIMWADETSGSPKVYIITPDGTITDFTSGGGGGGSISVDQGSFIVGDANSNPISKTPAEVRALLDVVSESVLDTKITTAIDSLVDGAPGALDTLKEIADALNNDDDAVATLTAGLANKVDKVAGKGLSENDFTDVLKTKVEQLGTASFQDVGTGANNVVVLDSNAKLPAVDGSQLTGLASGNISYNNGNFGMGTSTPTEKLDVRGNIALNYGGAIKVGDRSDFVNKNIVQTGWDNVISKDYTRLYVPGAYDSSTYPDNTPVMTLVNNGYVGIGTYNPFYKLHVNGHAAASSFITTSDQKMKENIKDIPIELIDRLSELNLKSFNFIDDEKKVIQYGVLAQDLEKIEKKLRSKNIHVELVNTDDYSQDFGSENELNQFLKDKPYLEAKKSIKNYTEKNVEKTKYIAKWKQKAVNYNNLFIIQQALLSDVVSVLKTQDLWFSVDDIKNVLKCKFSKKLEVETKDGNIIKSIEENNNTQHQRVMAWVDQGNEIKDKTYSVDEIKNEINKKVKSLILCNYSEHDQINLDRACLHLKAIEGIDSSRLSDDEKNKLDEHKKMDEKIASIRAQGKKLKAEVEKMSNTKLQAFSPSDASHWEGLE